jgi:AraC family transcriptional regulator, transcriptional activator FtrA
MRNYPATRRRPPLEVRIDPVLARASERPGDDDPSVAVLLLDGMNPFEFAVACEVFGIRRGEVLASMATPRWYDFRVCAPRPGTSIRTDYGFTLQAERGLDDLVTADTVIVPMVPKRADSEHQVSCWRIPDLPDDDVLDALRAAAERGARLVSFCSGAFALAEAGLLDGLRATTHWMYLESFRTRYPEVEVVEDVLYVDNDGRVLTAAGAASGIDLSLHVIRSDHGADIADMVARRMVVPPHRDGGQAQYTRRPPTPAGGSSFGEVLDWAVEHLHEPIEVADLADLAAMSPRTFARRFRDATGTTPHQWLTSQRVRRAQQLLETTDLPVDAVATRSGLGTAANLRTRLRDALGVSPSDYRQRFRRIA